MNSKETEIINKIRTIINSIDALLKKGITREEAIEALTQEIRIQTLKLEAENKKN